MLRTCYLYAPAANKFEYLLKCLNVFVHVLCFCVFCVKSMLLGCALRLQPLSIKYSSQLLNVFVLATKCTCLDLKIHLSKSCVSCWGHVTCMRLQPLPLMAIIKNKLNLKTSKPRSFSINTTITENMSLHHHHHQYHIYQHHHL